MLPFPRLRLCALLLLSLVLFPGTSVAQPPTPDGFSSRWTDPLFRFGHPYYSHLFIDTIYKDSNHLIPCQSVFDVRIAARLFSLGFDFSASGWDINEIRHGNLCNISLENSVSLAPGEPLKIKKKRLPELFLSGASLRIAFKGTLHIRMGSHIDSDFTSDGSTSIHLSTYFLEDSPDFCIRAVDAAEITYLTYRVSEF